MCEDGIAISNIRFKRFIVYLTHFENENESKCENCKNFTHSTLTLKVDNKACSANYDDEIIMRLHKDARHPHSQNLSISEYRIIGRTIYDFLKPKLSVHPDQLSARSEIKPLT
jgi:hypothetical protein